MVESRIKDKGGRLQYLDVNKKEHEVEVKEVTTFGKVVDGIKEKLHKTLFSRGHESWSETFFGSANGPPYPSQPPRLHVSRAVDPTLGDAETYSSFPGAASPTQPRSRSLQILKKKDLMKDIL